MKTPALLFMLFVTVLLGHSADSAAGACPPPTAFAPSGGGEAIVLAQLEEEYTRSRSGDKPDLCGAFWAAHELLTRVPDAEAMKWAEAMLGALLEQRDYRSAVVQGLRALSSFEILNEPKSRERIRWLILEAVNGAVMALGAEMDTTWLEYALRLKIPAEMNGRLLSYEGFLEDCPDSIYANRIAVLQSNAVSLYVDRELRIARFYSDRRIYVAAIARLESLIDYEFSDPVLPHILDELIRNNLLAADQIENPPRFSIFYRWKDEDIRAAFRLKPNEPVDRPKIAAILRAQAEMRTRQRAELGRSGR